MATLRLIMESTHQPHPMTASENSKTIRPDSPCVAVCSTLFDEICRGCGRTVMEVSNWVFMSQSEKDAVWERILAQGFPKPPDNRRTPR